MAVTLSNPEPYLWFLSIFRLYMLAIPSRTEVMRTPEVEHNDGLHKGIKGKDQWYLRSSGWVEWWGVVGDCQVRSGHRITEMAELNIDII